MGSNTVCENVGLGGGSTLRGLEGAYAEKGEVALGDCTCLGST